MYDLHNICESADAWAELFERPEFAENIAAQCSCDEINRHIELLVALDSYSHAATLIDRHLEANDCRLHHPDIDPPTLAAVIS